MTVLRKVLTILLIVAAFAGAYYLGRRKRSRRLDVFAQCLTAKQARMYGLSWCPHCAEQKEMFGSSFQYISYVECGTKAHDEEASCMQAGIKHFPTWQFASGWRQEGTLSLQLLSDKTGCSLP
jgi:glutaredoxin